MLLYVIRYYCIIIFIFIWFVRLISCYKVLIYFLISLEKDRLFALNKENHSKLEHKHTYSQHSSIHFKQSHSKVINGKCTCQFLLNKLLGTYLIS